MPVRLIGIDIDGTLLDSRGELPEANRAAIAAAIDQGVEVALATGRSFSFARPIADPLPDAVTLIVSNGALVRAKDGATRLRRLLPRDVACEVLASAARFRDSAAAIFDRAGPGQMVAERMDWEHPNRRGYFERNRASIAQVVPLEDALTDDPIQIMFNGSVAAMREVLATLRASPVADRVQVALTEYGQRDFSLLDVMTRGCSKGSALAEWARQLGIARDEVMAVGDNFNDREMLEFAGVRVVMGNAVPELKTLGWPITASHDEAGLARAIEHWVLLPNGRRR